MQPPPDAARQGIEGLVGMSGPLRALRTHLHQVAPLALPLLITGETGVGKTLVAQALHDGSPRRDRPLIIVDCAALQDPLAIRVLCGHGDVLLTGAVSPRRGAFARAQTGTLILKGIDHLSGAMQALVGRVVQTRRFAGVRGTPGTPVDVRLLAVTTQDLQPLVAARTFHAGLFYTLAAVVLTVPPLREHVEDIPLLVQHFGVKHRLALSMPLPGFTPLALAVLTRYPWPGNVRELENMVLRLAALCGARAWDVADLPPELRRT